MVSKVVVRATPATLVIVKGQVKIVVNVPYAAEARNKKIVAGLLKGLAGTLNTELNGPEPQEGFKRLYMLIDRNPGAGAVKQKEALEELEAEVLRNTQKKLDYTYKRKVREVGVAQARKEAVDRRLAELTLY